MNGVALVATIPYAGHRLYEQRLAAALSARVPVTYLEPPTSPRSLADVRRGGYTVDGGRTLVQPSWTVPFTRRLGLDGLRDLAARRAARATLPHLGGAATAVVYPDPTAALAAFPGARRVLLLKDDYVAGAHLLGQDPRDVERRLHQALAAADAVVVVSPVLQERLHALDVDAVVIPAGCTLPDPADPADPSAGAAPDGGPVAGRPARSRPLAVFLGGLSPRVLPGHLQAVLDAGCDLLLVGSMARTFPEGEQRAALEALLQDPRVDWRGHVDAAEVTRLLAGADVGLVPYDESSFNTASFPLKILEYLAAGLPVVSTPLPAVDWIASRQVHVHETGRGFGEAAAAVGTSADATVRAAARADAAPHTWEQRAEAWSDVLGLAAPSPDRPSPSPNGGPS